MIILNSVFFDSCQKTSKELNVKVWVVGGWVRDSLLGRESKDIDIVVEGNGFDFASAVAKNIDKKIKVNFFSNYGTAQFVYKGIDYEFVGARKESYSLESRNPKIEVGNIIEDLSRRDFTINALAISLNQESFGEVLDLFEGQKDLNNKILRTPLNPDITYSDDPLRIMRAIRFASQLNFDISKESIASIIKNAHRLDIISKERITTELNKIILSQKPSVGFKILFETKVLDFIFPELSNLSGVEEINGKGHKDNFWHTLQVLDNVSAVSNNLWLRWAAILHDIAKPMTKSFSEVNGWSFHGHEVLGVKIANKIFKKLKLPLDENLNFVKKMIFLHLRPIALTKEEITDSAIRRLLFEAGNDIDLLLILCKSDITSKNEEKVSKYLLRLELVAQKIIDVENRDKIKNFQPPISGELIMKTLQIGPSKLVGEIKNKIKDAILDGHIKNDFQEAFDFMTKIIKDLEKNC